MNYTVDKDINEDGLIIYSLRYSDIKIVTKGDKISARPVMKELLDECSKNFQLITDLRKKYPSFQIQGQSCNLKINTDYINSATRDQEWCSPFSFLELLEYSTLKRSRKIYNLLILEFINDRKLY
jgi:hypothetical protein